jgi:regulatory protein YycI of two-component signal transduction system YycFG
MTSTLTKRNQRNPWFSSNPLSRKPDRNHKLWNIVSTERDILSCGKMPTVLKNYPKMIHVQFGFIHFVALRKVSVFYFPMEFNVKNRSCGGDHLGKQFYTKVTTLGSI